jgi:hypothetical protein
MLSLSFSSGGALAAKSFAQHLQWPTIAETVKIPPSQNFGHPTRQRKHTKNSKQKFSEKELLGQSLSFHRHVPLSDLYIITVGLPVLLQEICGPILGIYI